MWKHNFILAFRNFKRNKTSFLINLIGLSTGLACVLLIYIWVNDEMNVDKFHKNDAQLFQIMNNYHGVDAIETWETSPLPLAETLLEEFPEVEIATFANYSFFPQGEISRGDKSMEVACVFAIENFFDVFSYELIKGNSKQVFSNKKNIVISEKLALGLFDSTEDAIGKVIHFDQMDDEFQISGIFSNLPSNSTEQFDIIIHSDVMVEIDPPSKEWNSTAGKTYVVLKEGTNIENFNKKIKNLRGEKDATMEANTLFAQQYSKKYLYSRYENGIPVGGRIEYIRYFSLLALFILLIACINFMNLSTAQASRKMKEIGVKKTLGVGRKALIFQFLSESIFMVILSLLAALGLVYILILPFNEVIGKTLQLNMDFNFILSILGIGLFTGLIAGSYPAFYLSGFSPVAVLKGKKNTSLNEQLIRKGLVVFQFALSVIFILGVLVVDQQLRYTQTKNMGYNRDNVISFQRPVFQDNIEVFLNEFRKLPDVDYASNMSRNIMSGYHDQKGYSWRGQKSDEEFIFDSPLIGYDVIETLGMNVISGRSFSKERNDNASKIVMNESAVKLMQLENPIGKMIDKNGEKKEIIGVVGDFHYGSLHHQVKPLIFRLRFRGGTIMIKMKAGSEKSTIAQIEKIYHKFHADAPFEYTFLDEDNQRLYEAEKRVAIFSKYIAGVAIIISCLGLFGLAMFTTERRKKEIGIRKVLGSSVFGIVRMLTSDFTKTVIIAILISLPISYFIAKNWLDNFAYIINLNGWYFLIPALLVLLIAWVTVGLQTFKAAMVNPVESLKDE